LKDWQVPVAVKIEYYFSAWYFEDHITLLTGKDQPVINSIDSNFERRSVSRIAPKIPEHSPSSQNTLLPLHAILTGPRCISHLPSIYS
jgi:hypothetical protein